MNVMKVLGVDKAIPLNISLMPDVFDLDRFVAAQTEVYDQALDEIRRGAKHTHWIWFIFPQLAGLGHSVMAQRYAIASLAEARAYLEHPVLGPRLIECVTALQDLPPTSSAETVFGATDAMKLRSSLTLFREAGGGTILASALERWFGEPDQRTLALLQSGASVDATNWPDPADRVVPGEERRMRRYFGLFLAGWIFAIASAFLILLR